MFGGYRIQHFLLILHLSNTPIKMFDAVKVMPMQTKAVPLFLPLLNAIDPCFPHQHIINDDVVSLSFSHGSFCFHLCCLLKAEIILNISNVVNGSTYAPWTTPRLYRIWPILEEQNRFGIGSWIYDVFGSPGSCIYREGKKSKSIAWLMLQPATMNQILICNLRNDNGQKNLFWLRPLQKLLFQPLSTPKKPWRRSIREQIIKKDITIL